MDEIITEKKYPIQSLWVLKSILSFLFALIIFIPFLIVPSWIDELEKLTKINFYITITIFGFMIFYLIFLILIRANIHYAIQEKFFIFKHGILSKQKRYTPYGVIQNLFIKQDLFDRIFGLASLTIENASQGAGASAALQGQKGVGLQSRNQGQIIGSSKNKISIPGLTKKNAEALKGVILQKMKENPIEDSQSGL